MLTWMGLIFTVWRGRQNPQLRGRSNIDDTLRAPDGSEVWKSVAIFWNARQEKRSRVTRNIQLSAHKPHKMLKLENPVKDEVEMANNSHCLVITIR